MNWLPLSAGSHNVSFGNATGYRAPSSQVVTINEGQTTTFQADYTLDANATPPSNVGLLRVTTNPLVPGQIYVEGVSRDDWGLNWLPLSLGNYTMSFGNVTGKTTPTSQMVTINAGQTTEVVGNYT